MEYLNKFCIELEDNNANESTIYGMSFVFSRIEKEIEDYLKSYKLSTAKFNAMMIIKHQGKDKGISQVEVGKKLIVTASNMTKLTDRMVKDGYVKRYAQQNDRRVNLVKITQKGADLLDKAWPGYIETVKELTSLLDTEDLKNLSGILNKWFIKLESKTKSKG